MSFPSQSRNRWLARISGNVSSLEQKPGVVGNLLRRISRGYKFWRLGNPEFTQMIHVGSLLSDSISRIKSMSRSTLMDLLKIVASVAEAIGEAVIKKNI